MDFPLLAGRTPPAPWERRHQPGRYFLFFVRLPFFFQNANFASKNRIKNRSFFGRLLDGNFHRFGFPNGFRIYEESMKMVLKAIPFSTLILCSFFVDFHVFFYLPIFSVFEKQSFHIGFYSTFCVPRLFCNPFFLKNSLPKLAWILHQFSNIFTKNQ